jgi:hypothetical protein
VYKSVNRAFGHFLAVGDDGREGVFRAGQPQLAVLGLDIRDKQP